MSSQHQAKFVTGSTMRHVVTMASTGTIGLMSVFLVDFANLYYISQLGSAELAAAIGYAGTLMFFNVSVSIGMMIGGSALVARALGAGDKALARRRASNALLLVVGLLAILTLITFPFIPDLLNLLGATGRTAEIAEGFMKIVLPSLPIFGIGMMTSGFLRAIGDAKRSMFITLMGAAITATLDPLFIFVFDLNVTGAAIVSVLSRIAMAAVGFYLAARVHQIISWPDFATLKEDARALAGIAGPAVLTNVATPVGNAYITYALAPYGDDAVAGWAIVGRILPLAFSALFALSGAVGPIFGQNYGARRFDRLRSTLRDSLIFILIYSVVIWFILFLLRDLIVNAFDVTGDAADLVRFFCVIIAASGIFQGMLFTSNAAFNNLGFPTYSTLFNWGKATLGTIPFVWAGAELGGPEGILAGQAIGTVIFGLLAILSCGKVIKTLEDHPEDGPRKPPVWRAALSAFSSGKSAGL